jgi:hypothetical protein
MFLVAYSCVIVMLPTIEAEILVEMRTAYLVAEVDACFTGLMLLCLTLGQVIMIDR